MDDRDQLDLLKRLQAGDEGAYDTVFRTWYPVLVRVASALLQDPDAAEDISQEVLLELWRRRHMLEAGLSLRAYLLRSVRNRSLNHLRHLRVRRDTDADVQALYDEPVMSDQPVVAK